MRLRPVSLIVTLVLGILSAPLGADAQQPAKVYRIGTLDPATRPTSSPPIPVWVAFWQGMRERGWVEGQNFVVVVPSGEFQIDRPDRFPALAAELVRLKPDVIVVGICGAPLNAAREATTTIPVVVMLCNDDLVRLGVVASLARPGGNITGLSKLTPELAAKRLSLIKEAFPQVSRVAVLWNPAYADFLADWSEIRAAARVLGVTLLSIEVRGPDEFETAFSAIAMKRADAVITFSDAVTYLHRSQLAEVAAKHRLPAMYAFRELPDAGGLMSYGPNLNDLSRRAAAYVDKILKGAKAGELPIEQPTRFEFVINLKTAKALALTIPQSILIRADQVIE